jgi:hypothetical protein
MVRAQRVVLCLSVLAFGCATASPEDGEVRLQDLPSICGEAGAPDACGDLCTGDSACGAGTYCDDGVCTAVCTSAGGQCGDIGECVSSGRCVPVYGDTASEADGSVCGELEVSTDRVIPNIMIIVDRSGSMRRDFEDDCPYLGSGCPNSGTPNPDFGEERWASVEDALVGSDGLVRRLDSIARFGLALYWKPGEDPVPMMDGDMCASTDGVSIGVSLDNADAIDARFAANSPSGYTPTAEAIDAVTDSILATPPPEGPTVYLLATDGVPNGCDEDEDSADLTNSILAVARARDLGIETYVLGVNFEDNHLQNLANVGQGVANGATLWTADSVSELQNALEQIVVQSIPCTVALTDGTIDTAQACAGDVRLNGEELPCDDAERGWRAIDGNTVELTGSACTDWRGGAAELEAFFPCYVIVQ